MLCYFICFAFAKANIVSGPAFDVSLFRRLSEPDPQAVMDLILRFEYRMKQEIMTLSKCGNEVANRTLKLKDRAFLRRLH